LQITRLEKDKKNAARKNHVKKVEQVEQSISSYEDDRVRLKDKLQDASDYLASISKALENVDARLRKLKPSLKLDRITDRCTCTKS
jgi:chromosome segregation ATPase